MLLHEQAIWACRVGIRMRHTEPQNEAQSRHQNEAACTTLVFYPSLHFLLKENKQQHPPTFRSARREAASRLPVRQPGVCAPAAIAQLADEYVDSDTRGQG